MELVKLYMVHELVQLRKMLQEQEKELERL
jgi:hypothetical protein